MRLDQRGELYRNAFESLDAIRERMLDQLSAEHPTAACNWPFEIDKASLHWDAVRPVSSAAWGQHYQPAFDVIAESAIMVTTPPPELCTACASGGQCMRHERNYNDLSRKAHYGGRSHSLWYCDAQQPGVFRWFETAFSSILETTRKDPIALPCGEAAGMDLAKVVTKYTLAWPFSPFDQDDTAQFIERWLQWFRLAKQGILHRTTLPDSHALEQSYRVQ